MDLPIVSVCIQRVFFCVQVSDAGALMQCPILLRVLLRKFVPLRRLGCYETRERFAQELTGAAVSWFASSSCRSLAGADERG
jgi:hypothetical protein